jgi:hypothetical protein
MNSHSRTVTLAAIGVLGLVLYDKPTFAQGRDASDIERGVKLMNQSDFAGALDAFHSAREKSPTPESMARIALAEQGLKRWVDAEFHLRAALSQETDPWIKRYRPLLEDAVADIGKHLGSLDIQGSPDGGVVEVDGEVIGLLPLRKAPRVPIGQHQVKVSAPDHEPLVQAVQIDAGRTASLAVSLKPSAFLVATVPTSIPAEAPRPAQPPRREPIAWAGKLGVVGLTLLILGDIALGTGFGIYLHNRNTSTDKPFAIAGGVGNIVGIGLIVADQFVGPAAPSPSATPANHARGVTMTWHF